MTSECQKSPYQEVGEDVLHSVEVQKEQSAGQQPTVRYWGRNDLNDHPLATTVDCQMVHNEGSGDDTDQKKLLVNPTMTSKTIYCPWDFIA